jgi:hypothetical protein
LLLKLIYNLGVTFAIVSFIWKLIEVTITILRKKKMNRIESYILKTSKYLLIANLTALYALNKTNQSDSTLFVCGIILVMYFMSKLQKEQRRMQFFQMQNNLNLHQLHFNLKAEVTIIILASLFFISLFFIDGITESNISLFFNQAVVDISNMFLIGFIFQLIGVFFVINIFLKTINSITYLLGGRTQQSPPNQGNSIDDSTNFDDYEEVD